MRRFRSPLIAAVLLVVVVAGAWVVTRNGDARDPVASAVSATPAGSRSVAVTVWSQLPDSVDKASLLDLTSVSIVYEFADELQDLFGWGPTDLSWEAAIVTPDGPAIALGLGSLDPAKVDEDFGHIGQREGDEWVVTRASNNFVSNFAYVRVLRSEGILVASSQPAALESVADTVRGLQPSLMTDRGVASLAQVAVGRASALFKGGPKLCADPDSGLDDDEVAALRQIERRHGALVDPMWTMRALDLGPRRYVFGTAYADSDTARRQADIRGALTTGPFLGRYGSVDDALTDPHADVDGSIVTFDFAPTERAEPYMNDSGPVLFAGCAVN